MENNGEASDLTVMIRQALAGDSTAEDRVLHAVYDQLRYQARRVMSQGGGSLQPTALVHEAWMRIFRRAEPPEIADRRAFFAYAARAMRNLVIDHVKKRKAEKRGGGVQREPLDAVAEQFAEIAKVDLLVLNEALELLRVENERLFSVVELKVFGAMTMDEIAEHHGVSTKTIERDWSLARAKLRRNLKDEF